jgi:transposase
METSTVNGLASRSSITVQTSEIVERPKRRRFSIAEKRRIVTAADACAPGTLGALLRREGIYSSLLARWRQQRNTGEFDAVTLRQRSSQKLHGQAIQRRNNETRGRESKAPSALATRRAYIGDTKKKAAGLLGIELKGPDANESD